MIVEGAFVTLIHGSLVLGFIRHYWEESPEDYPESAAMALGYYGA